MNTRNPQRALAALTGALLVVPAAGAATATATGSVATCAAGQLRAHVHTPGSGVAGGVYYRVTLRNASTVACGMDGYPGLSAVTRSGRELGSAAGRDDRYQPRPVTVAPGGRARFEFEAVDVTNFPRARCHPTHAFGLRVYPPNATGSRVVRLRIPACAASGPRYLSVRVVRG